jgi:DNA recombination protein RmuC
LVRPIGEALKKTEEKLGSLDRQHAAAFAGLSELKSETAKLARALARPEVRGRYGEIQLRRVAELAGMTPYCDFQEQASHRDAEGRLLRPDMIVHLPNQRLVAVDAKTNTDAYVQAASAPTPEAQEDLLERFADQMADQVTRLARKGYWREFDGSPDFVVMFVPGDQFLDAALARRPDLLDKAAEQNVILASPSTLIALLRAVAVGWREQTFADAARELMELGRVLHERAANVLEHAASVGKSLNDAVERYNRFVGSWESRLTPTLRKFEDAGATSGKELTPLPVVETRAATLLLFDAVGRERDAASADRAT